MSLLPTLALVFTPSGHPAPDSVDELVRAGRAALAAGRTADARDLFERARSTGTADGSLDTWLVRTEIAEGRFGSALNEAERVGEDGGPEADVEYLLGLASFGLARSALDAGRADGNTGNLLHDGQHLLARALAADPERYADAWPALAEAAWRNGDLEVAEGAAAEAVRRAPQDAALRALAGRVAFGRYQELRDLDAALAEGARADAREAFERCVELVGASTDAAGQRALAEARVQLGHLALWSDDAAGAAACYADAMAWDPSAVDFAQVHGALAPAVFAETTAGAVELFRERHGTDDARLATLAWWDGWSHWSVEDWERAADGFRTAVELWPAYASSWYWIHRAELALERFGPSVEALRAHGRADRAGLFALLAQDPASEAARLEWLVGWSADPAKHDGRARDEDAAFLCELLTELQPEVSRHWNNLGLFLRDRGDALRYAGEGEPAALADLWERSLAAYERALELEPENPNYVNDTAVLLHYYLQRDLDRARAMYLDAERLAADALAGQLDADMREVVAIALRDARDNVRRLDAWRERVAAGEADLDPQRVR